MLAVTWSIAIAGCGSKSSAPAKPARANVAAVESGGDGSIFSTLLSGIWDGVIITSSDSMSTWLMSGFGAANGESAQLAQISSQLQQIQSELTTINSTLVTIDNDLNRQTCDTLEATSIGPYTSRLNSLWIQYESLLGYNATTGTFSSNPDPSTGDIEQFIADANDSQYGGYYPDGGYSLATSLTNIWTGLDPAGSGAYGTLADCIKALGGTPATGTTDDESYYNDNVLPMEQYYYAYQLEAFQMMAEVYHFQAWQAAGSPTGNAPDVESNVCNDSSSSVNGLTPAYLCTEVANYIYEGYQQIVDQWEVGGAPYSDSNVVILNGTGLLFARSLQDFTTSNSSSCATPLSSTNPCGVLVGSPTESGTISNASYDGYGSWDVATATQLNELINPSTISGSSQSDWTSGTLASWLGSRGLSDPGGPYIVLTPQTGSVNLPWTNSYTFDTLCFLDTQMQYSDSGRQPFCNNGQSTFGSVTPLTRYVKGNELVTTYPATFISGLEYNSYYNIDLVNEAGNVSFTTTPDWKSPSSKDEYHWPVINTAELTCNSGFSATNPAGMPTMCGNNLTTYIAGSVPPPPSTTTSYGAEVHAVKPPAHGKSATGKSVTHTTTTSHSTAKHTSTASTSSHTTATTTTTRATTTSPSTTRTTTTSSK
jgi:hypothetical protein